MSLDLTAFAFALKERYPDEEIKDLALDGKPFLAMLEKDEDATGNPIRVPLIYGNPQARSASLSRAIANKSQNTKGKAFQLTRATDYSIASIDRHTMLASRNDQGAFAQSAETEMNGAIKSCARSLAKALYGKGTGSLGQISSGSDVGTDTITLSNINDVTNFEVGMVITADSVDGGGTIESGSVTLAGIDEDAGTLTASGNWTAGIATVLASYYLFQDGDYDGMITGLAGWVPSTAPTSTSFFGVDRTAHVTRLGGIRVTGTGMPIASALLKAAARAARASATPDVAFLNDVQYHQLIIDLGSKVEYVKQGVTAEVYFSGVVIHGPRGPIEVYPDYNCPSDVAYVLQMNTWKLYSIDQCPNIFDANNDQKMLREASSDGYEVRIGYYAQLGCNAPGFNAVVTLDHAEF